VATSHLDSNRLTQQRDSKNATTKNASLSGVAVRHRTSRMWGRSSTRWWDAHGGPPPLLVLAEVDAERVGYVLSGASWSSGRR
jgi:hypothetical protein